MNGHRSIPEICAVTLYTVVLERSLTAIVGRIMGRIHHYLLCFHVIVIVVIYRYLHKYFLAATALQ